jgi:hypothetical protein
MKRIIASIAFGALFTVTLGSLASAHTVVHSLRGLQDVPRQSAPVTYTSTCLNTSRIQVRVSGVLTWITQCDDHNLGSR